jgi:hypothetical protein
MPATQRFAPRRVISANWNDSAKELTMTKLVGAIIVAIVVAGGLTVVMTGHPEKADGCVGVGC